MAQQTILFLDLDGVLHPDPATVGEVFCRRPLLHRLLAARPQLDVVITSDWRLRHSLAELTALLVPDAGSELARRIIGVTPELPGARHEYEGRQRECLSWLTEYAPGAPWIAVDDVAGNFSFGTPHLVLTDHRVGLTERDIEHILARLP